MKYFSLNHNSQDVSFLDAVRKGLAPDRGLYFPNEIPKLPEVFYNNIKNFSNHDIAFQVIKPFVGDDIPVDRLRKIVEDTLNFDFPIVPITETMATLELFQGPTLAFK